MVVLLLLLAVAEISTTNELKSPVFAALALAFASVGDAFLYAFLPVNYAEAGVSVLWVGTLLSINRFVRIVGNSFVVDLIVRFGLRPMMIGAAVVAILSTFGYAIASGIIVWIIFRICWGLSFSAMRIGTIGYALHHTRTGFALGVSRSLQEMGPMLTLFAAPVLLSNLYGAERFIVLAVLSLPAIYFAYNLPVISERTVTKSSPRLFARPTTIDLITFVCAVMVDGIFIVVLGIFFLRDGTRLSLIDATAMAAFYLGYRRVCLVIISPLAGWISDRFGVDNIFNASLVLVIVGACLVVVGWTTPGVIIVFTFYSIHTCLAPALVASHTFSLQSVSINATWKDIGAAIGTLVGGMLLTSSYLSLIVGTCIFGLFSLFIYHRHQSTSRLKLFLWK